MNNERILFIFDWDDTLFPTKWFIDNKINIDKREITEKYILQFIELDNKLSILLTRAASIGTIIIVTNATKDWVLQSSKLLPNSSKILQRVATIVSARELYQDKFEMADWKMKTFNYNLLNYVTMASQIITIGDSDFEHNALVSLAKLYYKGKKLKTVRLSTSPTYEVVIDQLNVLSTSIVSICKHNRHMDIVFKQKVQEVQGISECDNFWDYKNL
jgi:hypothetical protein